MLGVGEALLERLRPQRGKISVLSSDLEGLVADLPAVLALIGRGAICSG